jgi:hypothetical protein
VAKTPDNRQTGAARLRLKHSRGHAGAEGAGCTVLQELTPCPALYGHVNEGHDLLGEELPVPWRTDLFRADSIRARNRIGVRLVVHKLLNPLATNRRVSNPNRCLHATLNQLLGKIPAESAHVEQAIAGSSLVAVLDRLLRCLPLAGGGGSG